MILGAGRRQRNEEIFTNERRKKKSIWNGWLVVVRDWAAEDREWIPSMGKEYDERLV